MNKYCNKCIAHCYIPLVNALNINNWNLILNLTAIFTIWKLLEFEMAVNEKDTFLH